MSLIAAALANPLVSTPDFGIAVAPKSLHAEYTMKRLVTPMGSVSCTFFASSHQPVLLRWGIWLRTGDIPRGAMLF
jgi:hypothetical protein